MSSADSVVSTCVWGPLDLVLTFSRRQRTNLRTSAVTRKTRLEELYFSGLMISLISANSGLLSAMATSVCEFTLSFISRTQSSGANVTVSSWFSPSIRHSLCCNQSGPCNHNGNDERVVVLIPRDGKSAGLSVPGQCFQSCGCTKLRIVVARFSTNCFHSCFVPFIQYRVAIESE